jgi:hypothetical protein
VGCFDERSEEAERPVHAEPEAQGRQAIRSRSAGEAAAAEETGGTSPPRTQEPFLERFWMVMRSNGRRPKVRHLTLEEAREEAQRIAANNPVCDCWVIECRTVETVTAPTVEGAPLVKAPK